MHEPQPDPIERRLRAAGVRPTSKRIGLARLLLDGASRHLTAEEVWRDARDAGLQVSLATVYNTLNDFTDAGLLRLVDLPGVKGVFDTNTEPHHHLLDERTGRLSDLPLDAVSLQLSPDAVPGGTSLRGVDVVVRVRS